MTSRENILGRIREAQEASVPKAKMHKPDFMADIYVNSPENHIEVIFAENFKKNRGIFFYAEDVEIGLYTLKSFLEKQQIEKIFVEDGYLRVLCKVAGIEYQSPETEEVLTTSDAVLSMCDVLIARTGGILLAPTYTATLQKTSSAQKHIVWAFTSQLVYDTQSALLVSKEKYEHRLPPLLTLLHEGHSSLYLLNPVLSDTTVYPRQEIILFLIDDIREEFSNPSQ